MIIQDMERVNKIISMYKEGHSLVYIGKYFGVSRQRIKQIMVKNDFASNKYNFESFLKAKQKIEKNRKIIEEKINNYENYKAISRELDIPYHYLNKFFGPSKRKNIKDKKLCRCSICKEIKPYSEFYLKDGNIFVYICKKCNTIRCREYQNKRKSKINEKE